MTCTEFQECLFEWLEGRLDEVGVERMKAHAAECLRCQELEELATGEAGLPAIQPPDDMVASILAQTTGGACDRALSLVCERLDEGAVEGDPLLEMHLDSCAECGRVARAIERLQLDLPAMAEMDPDAGFLSSVMAATVGTVSTMPSRDAIAAHSGSTVAGAPRRANTPALDWRDLVARLPLAARVSAFLERLLERPRLAFEGAFVGTLAFVLVIGVPSAGVAALPSRLMVEVRQERLEVQNAVAENWGRATDAGLAVLSSSTSRLGERLAEYVDFRPSTSEVGSRLEELMGGWRQAGIEIVTHLWEGDFGAAFARMWRLLAEPWRGEGNEEVSPGNTADHGGGERSQP
jgi:hypothetical protein